MHTLFNCQVVLNISTLFRELPLLERPAAARAAGYRKIEMWWPWEDAPEPTDTQAEALVRAILDAGVHLTGLNLFAGALSGPDAGIVSHPERGADFQANLDVALELGRRLGITVFNTLYGNRLEDDDPANQDAVATERLVEAVRRAAQQNATLLIEPISGPKPYPLRTSADARAVVDRVLAASSTSKGTDGEGCSLAGQSAPGIGWLCDLYHLAANGLRAEVIDRDLQAFGHRAAHLQVADSPGRVTPGRGNIGLGRQIAILKEAGYQGDLALEFIPPPGHSTASELARMAFAP